MEEPDDDVHHGSSLITKTHPCNHTDSDYSSKSRGSPEGK